MRQTLTPRTSRLLDIRGFDTVDVQDLAALAAASPVHPFDGTERRHNGVQLARALSKSEGFEGHSRPDAAIFRSR